jgi:uncharacterized protein
MRNTAFSEEHILHELKHYLPTQTPLKDFIHHNSLHAFQEKKFYNAIFDAEHIFGYQVTFQLKDYRALLANGRIKQNVLDSVLVKHFGADANNWKQKVLTQLYNEETVPRIGQLRMLWKSQYSIDIDTLVQPLLFRVLASYLDQGIAIIPFPKTSVGLLDGMRELEKNSAISFFKTKKARELFLNTQTTIPQLLALIVGEEAYYDQYIFDQQFSHRGWSGMVATLEDQPHTLLAAKKIALADLIILDLLLEIDVLENTLPNIWQPIASFAKAAPKNIIEAVATSELHEVLMVWQDAFEWSYYDEALAGLAANATKPKADLSNKTFQAIFCIDERECSLRRHIEGVDVNAETLGMPGFFGVEFYFQSYGAKFYDKLCPAPVTPKYLIKESEVNTERKHDLFYTNQSHTLIGGFLSTFTLGFWAGLRMVQNLFSPKMSPAISNAFAHVNKSSVLTVENKSTDDIENNLQIGFTIDEMTNRVENVLRGIGLLENFADVIYFVAHGSSSANNPHHGAHDCGACSGRPGSVNARVISMFANHAKVREQLVLRGITIPASTQFIGSLHDTAADEIEFYDLDILNSKNHQMHQHAYTVFNNALDLNAQERSRRFASIQTNRSLNKVRLDIKKRSVSLFEPRPELGHGTNSLCIIGSRNMTRGLFLDRRAFLNSYNYKTDLEGKILANLIRPIGPVCGGINLEYYFSRMDNYKLGAGTKLPHNVVGLIGVANSSDGDLRPGLPLQMIEVHDPIRLLVIVEHFPEVLLQTIKSDNAIYEWYNNEWVHIVAMHPETKQFYYFKNEQMELYTILNENIESKNINRVILDAKEMPTNYIADATKENLPIYLINS